MWIVRLSLQRPYTFIVMALVIILLTPVVLLRTPTDIFPEINIPVISLVWTFTGLEPQEMEQRITGNVERGIATLVNDVEHTESQSLNGIAVIKVYFQPNANIQTALAQTGSISQTFLRFLPPGITPPLVIIYSASTVPVIQLGLTSDTLNYQPLFDTGNNFIRTQLATIQGAATPFPYGGKQRLVSVDTDTTALQSKGLSAVDIVNAVNAQNLILPTGTAKLGTLEYTVEMNGSPRTVAELNDLPIKTVNGATIYMRDVAHVRDGFSPQTNAVLANGQRGVLMSIYKTGNASTLDIVDRVKAMLMYNQGSYPEGLKVTQFFDQSVFVRASIQGVVREGLIAAVLTAFMILLFLGNWKSTIIIAISIPLSILVSILLLSALGETINIMTSAGWRWPSAFWSTTPRWKSKTSTATWPWARRRCKLFWTARNRSPCPPSFPRCASASCSFPCFFSREWRAFCSCRWPKQFPSPCSRPTCGRERSCRPWRCTCSPRKTNTAPKNTRERSRGSSA